MLFGTGSLPCGTGCSRAVYVSRLLRPRQRPRTVGKTLAIGRELLEPAGTVLPGRLCLIIEFLSTCVRAEKWLREASRTRQTPPDTRLSNFKSSTCRLGPAAWRIQLCGAVWQAQAQGRPPVLADASHSGANLFVFLLWR